MTAPRPPVQICNGLGAGNIGDELMNRAFWDALPPAAALEVEVFPNHALQREPYEPRHRLVEIGWEGRPLPEVAGRGALIVGDTPVTETLGIEWPLRFLAARLQPFVAAEAPIDAIGVGVEPLRSAEARDIFGRVLRPVRSWTVRSEPCRRALLDLGVEEERIRVGADWAWAYRPRRDRQEWADATWRGLGVQKDRPLLVVNVVNEIWRDREEVKSALADALDALAADGFQVAFFCNEARDGEFYDRAAADAVAGRMKSHAIVVPNLYYGPDEVLALLKPAAATVATRYHFIVESVLAGTVPVPITRSAKTEVLARELDLAPGGTVEGIDAGALAEAVRAAVRDRATLRPRLAAAARSLAQRTRDNLAFWNRAQG